MATLRPTKLSASSNPSAPANLLADLLLPLSLFALTLLTFSPALSADFVRWDDPTFITENQNVHGVTSTHLRWMFTAFHGGHYHPFTWLSWALDYELWGGLKPLGFHLTNILLHAANSILVYFLLKRLITLAAKTLATPSLHLASFLGATAFALHPLRAESVAWATERRDVLSALFLLAATLAYLSAVSGHNQTRRLRPYLLSIALLILSCLSKAWGMSFFALMLVLDIYPLRRLSFDRRAWLPVLIEKIPCLLIGLITAGLAAAAQHTGMAAKTLEQWGLQERIVQSLYGLWFYTRATFAPSDLSPLYQLPIRIDPWEPRFIAAYIFIVAALIAMLALRKRFPALLAAGAIYVISLAPVLGLFQSGEQFVADRYSYLACIIYSALLAGALVAVLRWSRTDEHAQQRRPLAFLAIAGTSAATLALAALAYAQTAIWHNTETLWSHAVEVSPGSQVLVNYAIELDRLGRDKDADDAVLAATKLDPTDGRAWFTYAGRMRDKGNLLEAEKGFKEAAKYMPQAYQAFQNLGVMYAKHNHPEAALQMFRAAVADVEKGGRRPLSGGPYMTLAFALEDAKQIDEAVAALRTALTFADTREAAAKELQRLGK